MALAAQTHSAASLAASRNGVSAALFGARFAPLPFRRGAIPRIAHARPVKCSASAEPATDAGATTPLSFQNSGHAPPSASDSWQAAALPEPLGILVGKALKPALAAALVAALLWTEPGAAMAAQSSGRAGGSSFAASRAKSYSAPGGSYSAPSYRAPAVGPAFSAPFFFAPSPFFFPSFGPTIYLGGGGGFGWLNIAVFGVIAWLAVSTILNFWGGSTEEEVWDASPRSSVVRLQVGLIGTARELQKDLEKMAERADTSTPEGLHYVLQESVLSLLRNPDYCIYGYTTSEVTQDSYEGEQAFNRLSMEERSKFKEETLVNVGDVRKRKEMQAAEGGAMTSEYIVVTIIAATEGEFQLPEIRSSADLRSALNALGSITADELQAVEILWTPENEEDTLTTKDLLQDYPLLRPL